MRDIDQQGNSTERRAIRSSLDEIEKWCAEQAAKGKRPRVEKPVQLFLPGLEDFMRAMPNHIARSSLFAPVARGRKKIHKDAVLVSRSDATIKFWGEQLDEAQADVWMQAMREAGKKPLGEPVVICRAAFLRAIGRQTGKYEYDWLNRAMKALSFAMLVIEAKKGSKPKYAIGHNDALHMIAGFAYDADAEAYTLRIDPRWHTIYSNREFALIDWEKRMQFGRGQDMAKALQRLVATSDELVQRFELEWLRRKLEYTSPTCKFRTALTAAMREMERLTIIAGGRIEHSTKGKEQAAWTKL